MKQPTLGREEILRRKKLSESTRKMICGTLEIQEQDENSINVDRHTEAETVRHIICTISSLPINPAKSIEFNMTRAYLNGRSIFCWPA